MRVLDRNWWRGLLLDLQEIQECWFQNPQMWEHDFYLWCYPDDGIGYEIAVARTKSRWWKFKFQCYRYWHLMKALRCAFGEHKWIDQSYGGPDSGCIDMYCSRCDKSFHHTLY
jgi:hypothetical protein